MGVVHVDLSWSIAASVLVPLRFALAASDLRPCALSWQMIRTPRSATGLSALACPRRHGALLDSVSFRDRELVCSDSWEFARLVLFGSVCLRALPLAAASSKGTSSMEGFLRMAHGSTKCASTRSTLVTYTACECHGLPNMLVLSGLRTQHLFGAFESFSH